MTRGSCTVAMRRRRAGVATAAMNPGCAWVAPDATSCRDVHVGARKGREYRGSCGTHNPDVAGSNLARDLNLRGPRDLAPQYGGLEVAFQSPFLGDVPSSAWERLKNLSSGGAPTLQNPSRETGGNKVCKNS